MHNEELHNLYSLPNIIRMIYKVKKGGMGRACSIHEGEKRNTYMVFVENPDGKRPLRRLRHMLEDNIKMDHTRNRLGWYGLNKDQCQALVNKVINFWVP
jgi:hypothetical protein